MAHKGPDRIIPVARIKRDNAPDYFIPLLTAWKLECAGRLVVVVSPDGRNTYKLKERIMPQGGRT